MVLIGYAISSFFFFVEDIIRRRLLYDGDGTGDDKRITTILKTIIKWSATDCEEEETYVRDV